MDRALCSLFTENCTLDDEAISIQHRNCMYIHLYQLSQWYIHYLAFLFEVEHVPVCNGMAAA